MKNPLMIVSEVNYVYSSAERVCDGYLTTLGSFLDLFSSLSCGNALQKFLQQELCLQEDAFDVDNLYFSSIKPKSFEKLAVGIAEFLDSKGYKAGVYYSPRVSPSDDPMGLNLPYVSEVEHGYEIWIADLTDSN